MLTSVRCVNKEQRRLTEQQGWSFRTACELLAWSLRVTRGNASLLEASHLSNVGPVEQCSGKKKHQQMAVKDHVFIQHDGNNF